MLQVSKESVEETVQFLKNPTIKLDSFLFGIMQQETFDTIACLLVDNVRGKTPAATPKKARDMSEEEKRKVLAQTAFLVLLLRPLQQEYAHYSVLVTRADIKSVFRKGSKGRWDPNTVRSKIRSTCKDWWGALAALQQDLNLDDFSLLLLYGIAQAFIAKIEDQERTPSSPVLAEADSILKSKN
ncbi:MAG: hypothetical protein WCV85_01275 [Patescibacteria group bacterium]|jgi:hypothetical protein